MHLRLCWIKERSWTSTTLAFVYVWWGRAVNRTGWDGWVIQSRWWESCKLTHTHANMVRIGLCFCLSSVCVVCLLTCCSVCIWFCSYTSERTLFTDLSLSLQLLFACPLSVCSSFTVSLPLLHTNTHTHTHTCPEILITSLAEAALI